MKTFFRFLSLLLCLEFILGPMGHSVLINQDAMAQETCPTGQKFNGRTNRCETIQDVINANAGLERCRKMTSKEQQQECFNQEAKDQLESSDAKKNPGFLSKKSDSGLLNADGTTKGKNYALSAGALAVPLFLFIQTMMRNNELKKTAGKNVKCNPISLLLMYGGGAALALGEIISFAAHNKKLKDGRDRWKQIATPDPNASADKQRTQATEAQSQAFALLAENEKSIEKVAKTKKGFYLAATSIFAASALAATLEVVQIHVAKKKIDAANAFLKAPVGTPAEIPGKIKEQYSIIQKETATINKLTCYTDNDRIKEQKEAIGTKKVIEHFEKYPLFIFNNDDKRDELIFEIESLKRIPLKIAAINNIAGASTLDDFAALSNELEAVEFVNYTSLNQGSIYKEAKLKLDPLAMKLFSQILLIENGFAQEEISTENDSGESDSKKGDGKFISTLGTIAGSPWKLLKSISNKFKFKNGQNISFEELDKIDSEMNNKFNKAIYKPGTRIAISGVLGIWMGIMTDHMAKTAKAADDRAKKLMEIKAGFESHAGLFQCKEEDRTNTNKPECYCYTSDNTPNPARARSKICANAYAAYAKNNFNYLNVPEISGCLASNGNVDGACKCRQTRSCMKMSGFDMKGMSPGTFRMLNGAMAPVNDLITGNSTGAQITSGAGTNAARIKKAQEDLLKKTDPNLAREIASLQTKMEKDLANTGSGLTMGSNADSSPIPMNPQQAAAELEKELKKTNEDLSIAGGAGGSIAIPSGLPEPEFGLSEEGLAIQESQVAEVMKEDLDYGNNDIHGGSSVNIFEALSQRYQRSGMKRLFDETSSGPVEQASDKEIRD